VDRGGGGKRAPNPRGCGRGGGGERKGFQPPGRRRRRSERGKKKTSRRHRSFEPKSLDRQFSASPSSLSSFSLTCPLACPRPFLLLGLRDPGAGDRFPRRRRSPVEVSAAAEATRTMRRPAATTGVARAAVDDGDESAEPRLAETDVSCFFIRGEREDRNTCSGEWREWVRETEEDGGGRKGGCEIAERQKSGNRRWRKSKAKPRRERERLGRPIDRSRSPRGALCATSRSPC